MDLALNDEQLLIKDSVERFVLNDYSFDKRQKLVAEAPGYSQENWATFAELGWLAIPFSEEDGGLDGTAIESMVVFEQFGRAIVVEPFIPTVVLAGGAIRDGCPEDPVAPPVVEHPSLYCREVGPRVHDGIGIHVGCAPGIVFVATFVFGVLAHRNARRSLGRGRARAYQPCQTGAGYCR